MNRYKVHLKKTLTLYAIVEIDAISEREAGKLAREHVSDTDAEDAQHGSWRVERSVMGPLIEMMEKV